MGKQYLMALTCVISPRELRLLCPSKVDPSAPSLKKSATRISLGGNLDWHHVPEAMVRDVPLEE
jgi:hypothetical protein